MPGANFLVYLLIQFLISICAGVAGQQKLDFMFICGCALFCFDLVVLFYFLRKRERAHMELGRKESGEVSGRK